MTPKEAIAKAFELAKEYYMAEFDVRFFRLEEIEAEGPYWLVTISMPRKDDVAASIFGSARKETEVRSYKVFKFDKNSGNFISMKIREFA